MTRYPAGRSMDDSRLPLYQRIRDDMLARIVRGEWRPGEVIPTESALTQEYGVATGTLRKAVDTLVADHLLIRAQGRGTFVARPRFAGSLLRFFRQVDPDGEPRAPRSEVLACERRHAPDRIREALAVGADASTLYLERMRHLDEEHRLAEDIWLPEAGFPGLVDWPLSAYDNLMYPFYERVFGVVVASAQETLTVEIADDTLSRRLAIPPASPIVVIERIALGYDRRPVEYRRSYGPADRFRYQIDIS